MATKTFTGSLDARGWPTDGAGKQTIESLKSALAIETGVSPSEYQLGQAQQDSQITVLQQQQANLTALVGTLLPGSVTLQALTLDNTAFVRNSPFTVNILGKSAGSTITATSSDGSSLGVSGAVMSGIFTGSGAQSVSLVEALPGALNSPNPSNISVNISVPAQTLTTLTLSGTLQIGAATSGAIIGATAGSTIVSNIPGITVNSGARTYSGTPTGDDLYTVPNGLVETLSGYSNSPNPSAITVQPAINLGTLSLSGALQVGLATSGTILGATDGSTIAGNIPGITVDSVARTYSGTPTTAATVPNGLVETLAGAVGSPKNNSVTVAAASLGTLGLSGLLVNGTASSGTITGATTGSTITKAAGLTGLTINSGARTYSWDGTNAAGTTSNGLTETLVGATGSPKDSPITVLAEAPAITILTNTANGMPIGTVADSSIYSGKLAGMKLVAQDDFDLLPNLYSGGAMTDYSANTGHVPTTPSATANEDRQEAWFARPSWRGPNNEYPNPLGYQQMSVAGSVLTMEARIPTSGELATLPTTGFRDGPPKVMSAALKTGPSFRVSGQGGFGLVQKVQFEPGVLRGSWESGYFSSTLWPDGGEPDMFEVRRDPDGTVRIVANINGSTVDGGGNVPQAVGGARLMPTRPVLLLMRKDVNGTDLAMYDDTAVEGVISSSPTAIYSGSRVSRFKGAMDFRCDFAIRTSWDGSTFNAADFATPRKFKTYFWQAFTASSRTAQPYQELGVVNAVAGQAGGWNFTLPSVASLYGSDTPTLEQAMVQWSNTDCPGSPHVGWLPAGMTADLSARTLSGNIPTGKAGRTRVLVLGTFADGGPARGGYVTFNIAPIASTVFNSQTVALSGAVNVSIPFNAFISGDLNHVYSVTSNKAWAVVTMGSGNKSATISGTAPSSDDVATITITATNGAGQTTTVTRTITATNTYSPSADANVLEYWDFNDNTTVFSDAGTTQAVAGSSSIAQANGKKGIAALSESTSAKPTYVTDGITSRKAAKFTRASVQRLQTSVSTIAALATGNDKGFTIVEAVRRGTAGQSITTSAFWRSVTQVGNQSMIRNFVGSGNTVGMIRFQQSGDGTSQTAASASAAAASDAWYVITRIFSGTNLIVRVNGVEVYNATFDTAPFTGSGDLTSFSIGAHYNNASAAWDSSTAFGGEFDSLYLLSTISMNASVTAIEQRAAAAVGVTLP
jgi:hypothetical protein